MKRALVLGVLTGAWLAAGSITAAASGAELEDFLHGADEAAYSGRQIVVSYWESEVVAGLYDVARAGGVIAVGDGGTSYTMGEGKVDRKGSSQEQMVLSEWARWRLHERYELGDLRETTRLGRSATRVTIREEGRTRVRITFDDGTGAPLLSEVFDDRGRLYRMAVMIDFDPARPTLDSSDPREEYQMESGVAAVRLPSSAGGYWRADTYAGPNATTHAFYTDGLFSFSVFEMVGRADAGTFAEAEKWKVGDHTYRRISDPGVIRLFWLSPDYTYLLVGDLPPDHLRRVLVAMPEPGSPNLFVRIWRGLFG